VRASFSVKSARKTAKCFDPEGLAMSNIFISLTHSDTEIAQAIHYVLSTLFDHHIKVDFSTSKEIESGIKPGEDWIAWIEDQVKTCDFVLALMTPTSVRKPWVLWELGAVYGAAAAMKSQSARKIRPLLYRIRDDDIPAPLRDNKIQYKRGDNRADAIELFIDIVEGYRQQIPPAIYRRAITLLENEKEKPEASVSQEAEQTLQQLKDSRAIIGAYFRMVDVALDRARQDVPAEEWHEGLFQNAPHAITGVLVLNAKEGDMAKATIQKASANAEEFYGFAPNSGKNLVGKQLTDLVAMLKDWMHPNDFAAFMDDQKTNGARFAEGRLAAARVPILFNDEHPKSALRGKSFLPFTLHMSQGAGGAFMTILYLDLKALPSQLKKQLRPASRGLAGNPRPALVAKTTVM
jgi:hypothetical protein